MEFDLTERTPLELAVSLMGKLHFHPERPQPWWGFAIYHAQRTQIGCAVHHGSPGMSIFNTDEVYGMSINDTIEESIFGAIADAMKGGPLAANWKHELVKSAVGPRSEQTEKNAVSAEAESVPLR